jgi:hypothetical protein
MAAMILAAPQILSTVVALVNAGIDGYATAQRVTTMIADKNAKGQPITQGDLSDAIGDDDAGKKALEDAIART